MEIWTILDLGTPFLFVLAYLFHRQYAKKRYKGRLGSWVFWFVIMTMNALVYFTNKDNESLRMYLVLVEVCLVTVIITYKLFDARYTDYINLSRTILILWILSVAVIIFWQISGSAHLSHILLNALGCVCFVLGVIVLTWKRLRQKHAFWVLLAIASFLQSISLLMN